MNVFIIVSIYAYYNFYRRLAKLFRIKEHFFKRCEAIERVSWAKSIPVFLIRNIRETFFPEFREYEALHALRNLGKATCFLASQYPLQFEFCDAKIGDFLIS